jgi:hypothetical protein
VGVSLCIFAGESTFLRYGSDSDTDGRLKLALEWGAFAFWECELGETHDVGFPAIGRFYLWLVFDGLWVYPLQIRTTGPTLSMSLMRRP